jgi:thiol-disulfide isomerase/thioredoxin
VVVAIVAALVLAVAVTAATGGDDSGSGDQGVAFDTSTASVSIADGGGALPEATDADVAAGSGAGADPAVGMPAPVVEGVGLDGRPVTVPTTGRPTIVVFLAHWCPHCQREVPQLQRWIDEGALPEGVDVVGVATGFDPELPNYPASAWLDREGWTPATVADGDGSAATAYGVSGFPFWVAVAGDGTVVERRSGELTLDDVTALAETARDATPS